VQVMGGIDGGKVGHRLGDFIHDRSHSRKDDGAFRSRTQPNMAGRLRFGKTGVFWGIETMGRPCRLFLLPAGEKNAPLS